MENPSRKLSCDVIQNSILKRGPSRCFILLLLYWKGGEGDKENYLRHVTGVSHDLSHDVTNTSILECQFLCCMPATRLFFLQC